MKNLAKTLQGSKLLEMSILRKGYALALVAGEHALQVGPYGQAKTFGFDEFVGATDLEKHDHTTISGYKGAMDEILVGYPNTGALMEGRWEPMRGPSMLNRKVVYVDEIDKIHPATQAILLQLLQSRRFSRGGVDLEIPLEFCVAGGNEPPPDGPVRDRFAVQFPVELSPEGMLRLISWGQETREEERAQGRGEIRWEEIREARGERARVVISKPAKDLMMALATEFGMSPRRLAQYFVKLVQANATLRGVVNATVIDVYEVAPYVALFKGPLTMQAFVGIKERLDQERAKLGLAEAAEREIGKLTTAMTEMRAAMEAGCPEDAEEMMRVLVKVQNLAQAMVEVKNPDDFKEWAGKIREVLAKAETVHHEVLQTLKLA